MVQRCIDQKLRLRNFDPRNERIEAGAVVTNRSGQRGIGRGQGKCYPRKVKKDSVREETNAVSGTTGMSVRLRATNTKKLRRGKKELQRQESVWEDQSTAVQRLLERYLHQITL